ncbi:hypothetical protein BDA96_01G225000 [Sorghum bicolor]|uniref:Uncharacterized protein n=1 Tax=Sorghum bicolor TaxID=4558 RepID=A0A921S0L6_SORBI|nr:hypothetical protein BDA96_01G225000 [Sorghum bicolor]
MPVATTKHDPSDHVRPLLAPPPRARCLSDRRVAPRTPVATTECDCWCLVFPPKASTRARRSTTVPCSKKFQGLRLLHLHSRCPHPSDPRWFLQDLHQ